MAPSLPPPDLGPWQRVRSLVIDEHVTATVYERTVAGGGFLRVIVGQEPHGWHLSISHNFSLVDPVTGGVLAGRLPTWEEIKEARYRFVPDHCVMAQILPPKSSYIDLAKTALHLWELPVEVAASFIGPRGGALSS